MPYKVIPEKRYEKKFGRFPKDIQRRINEKIAEKLVDDPYANCQVLAGEYAKQRVRKFRVGDYRVLLIIVDAPEKRVYLVDCDDRGSAYSI